MRLYGRLLCGWVVTFLVTACGGSDQDLPSDPDNHDVPDAATVDADGPSPDAPLEASDDSPTDAPITPNTAEVFLTDPLTTPNPTRVELEGVADDLDGTLTSEADSTGVRLIRVVSCVDEGETNVFQHVEQRVCTLRQLANKNTNGSFLYDDYESDQACGYEPDNVHTEVNLYYHVHKIYSMVTDPEVGVFDKLPGRHFINGTIVPLTVVANYRAPVPASATALEPTDMAFFGNGDYMALGMAAYNGLPGVRGDALVFGQGAKMDFGYDAETVYHEFGHAVVNATAKLNYAFADTQGLTNQPTALNEGIANTMAFLGSGESLLGEYLEGCDGPGWACDAQTTLRFPDDLTGHPVLDGLPVLAANYSVHQAMVESWGGSSALYLRVLLLTLTNLHEKDGDVTYPDFADEFLQVLAEQGLGGHVEDARAMFAERGLLETQRVVDLTGVTASDQRWLLLSSAATEMWNTWIDVEDDGSTYPLATAYVQHRIDVPSEATQAVIKAEVVDVSRMTEPGDLDIRLFVRSGNQIEYTEPNYHVVKDAEYLPELTTSGDETVATWTLPVTANDTLFLHFVNRGTSEGALAAIDVSLP